MELENGLLEGRADIAVHSMKDVPIDLPNGLCLPVILAREEPYDTLRIRENQRFFRLRCNRENPAINN